jgi:hypothetical protein
MGETTIDTPEDSIMLVADDWNRCEHFEVFVNDRKLGETWEKATLDNYLCGDADSAIKECGSARGYFYLPKGVSVSFSISSLWCAFHSFLS